MRKLILSILCIYSLNIFGQVDFRPGYIVVRNHDTIRGLINYISDIQNSLICDFKLSNNADIEHYQPYELISYRFINGKYYISKKVKIENNIQEIFLEFLLEGRVNVFFCRTNSGDHYFIEKDSLIYELENSEQTKSVGSKTIISQSQIYKGILRYFFQDDPALTNKIDKMNLNRGSIINISKEYHEAVCPDEQCIIFEKQTPNVNFQYGITVNYGLSKFSYKLDYYTYNLQEFSSTGANIFLRMNIPDWNENLYFEPNISFLNFQDDRDVSTVSEDARLLTDIKSIGINIFMNYGIPIGKFNPYLYAGPCFFANIKKSVLYKTNYDIKDYSGDKGGFIGLSVGTGIEYDFLRKIAALISVKYEFTSLDTRGVRIEIGFVFK